MARIIVPEAEALMDQEIPVLDRGFVRLVDYMGGDQRIVQAARVSYGGGTKSFRQDRSLIHYLLRNDHTSPFEQVNITVHAKMPIFVARQWVRHRTASLNEISGRYSILKEEFYLPPADQMRMQSQDNKQGRAEDTLPRDEAEMLIQEMGADQHALYEHYEQMIERGLAREIARANLPLALYTEWYWQIDLHNLFRFLRLRMDAHAQYEIRCYAEALARIAQAIAPLAYEAFEEHVLNSVRLGREECMALARMLAGGECGLEGRAKAIFDEKIAKMAAMEPIAPIEEPEIPA